MEMTFEELLRRYAAGERDFAGVDLRYNPEEGLRVAILKEIALREEWHLLKGEIMLHLASA